MIHSIVSLKEFLLHLFTALRTLHLSRRREKSFPPNKVNLYWNHTQSSHQNLMMMMMICSWLLSFKTYFLGFRLKNSACRSICDKEWSIMHLMSAHITSEVENSANNKNIWWFQLALNECFPCPGCLKCIQIYLLSCCWNDLRAFSIALPVSQHFSIHNKTGSKLNFMKDRDKLFISWHGNNKIVHHRTKRENTSPIFSTLCATGPCKPVSQPGYDGNLPDDRPKVRNDKSDNYHLYEVIW